MKNIVVGIAIGTAAGLLLSEVPCIKTMLEKGKKKIEKMTK